MAHSHSSHRSIAASIASEIYTDAPPSYSDAIRQQDLVPPPSQALQSLSLQPPSPTPRVRRKPLPRTNSDSKPSRIPTTEHCLIHLRLLQCFHRLREDIGRADGLFGLREELVAPGIEPEAREQLLAKLCEKRWEIYVTRAVLRFQSYWRMLQPDSKMLLEDNLKNKGYVDGMTRAQPWAFTSNNLPPIDVLMVYHAFMLNPRNFFADCVRYGKTGAWSAGMPWDAIADAFQGQHSDYRPNDRSCAQFAQKTRLPWDNLDEPAQMTLRCPKCTTFLRVPWTTTDNKRTWASPRPGEDGLGFADKGFCHDCQCGAKVTHEVLRTQRFKSDLRALFTQGQPMPGTFLTAGGTPATALQSAPGAGAYQMTFPNRLIKSGLGKVLAQTCSIKDSNSPTMKAILQQINAALENQTFLRRAAKSKSPARPPLPQERLAIRRMMSAYWENSSIFSIDLVGAVIRQNSFTSKMYDIDWLHSPAVTSTVGRLIEKYENYISIMARYSNQTVVPTLDIDLAWHTHQLSPRSYYDYTIERTNSFINHDDKVEEIALSTAFEWTSKTYQEMFNKIYSECTCWYCEAIRESHEPPTPPPTSKISRLLKSTSSSASDPLAISWGQVIANSKPSEQGPHISAHNATRSKIQDAEAHIQLVVQSRRFDRAYELACRKAEKEGLPMPQRDDGSIKWGYKMIPREGYGPFMTDTYLSEGLFVVNPACSSNQANCCPEGPSTVNMGENGALGPMGSCVTIGKGGGKGVAVGACGSCGSCGSGFCGGSSGYGGCAGDGDGRSGSGSGVFDILGAGQSAVGAFTSI